MRQVLSLREGATAKSEEAILLVRGISSRATGKPVLKFRPAGEHIFVYYEDETERRLILKCLSRHLATQIALGIARLPDNQQAQARLSESRISRSNRGPSSRRRRSFLKN